MHLIFRLWFFPSIQGVDEEEIKICVLTQKPKKNTTEKKPSLKNKGTPSLNFPREKPLFVRNWIIRRPFAIDGEKSLDFVVHETYVKVSQKDLEPLNSPNRAFNQEVINTVEDNFEVIDDEVNLEVIDEVNLEVINRVEGNFRVVDEFNLGIIDEVNELIENDNIESDYEYEIPLSSCDEDENNATVFEEILEAL